MEDVRSRQGKLMKMLVKVHEILKFRDSSSLNEDEMPQIERQDDFDSVEDALLDPATKKKLISYHFVTCLDIHYRFGLETAFFNVIIVFFE